MEAVRFVGPNTPATKTWLVRCFFRPAVSSFAGDRRPLFVQLINRAFQLVIRLRDGGGVKGVCLQDIGARGQEVVMDALNYLRLGSKSEDRYFPLSH